MLLLIAMPPAGAATWVVWASWILVVGGTYAAWFSTGLNCTAIRSVYIDEKFTASSTDSPARYLASDRYCYYGYQSTYRWDDILGTYVPIYIRWNC
ncbi:MAG: hypothetical protein ACE5F5_08950 [Acidimicrobiia bacterium]